MNKEYRLIPEDDNNPTEYWETGYWIPESKVIDMLHTLHMFNKLNDKLLKLMSTSLNLNLMEICKQNGITWFITEKALLCPKCQSNIIGQIGAVIFNSDASDHITYNICNICGHKWQ